jgi:hypothetical protein
MGDVGALYRIGVSEEPPDDLEALEKETREYLT